MSTRLRSSAYTFIELIVAIAILGTIIGMSVFTIFSYYPKQRLLDSVETLEQTLNRAQLEAKSRAVWSCIQFNSGTRTMNVFMDVDANHGAAGSCGNVAGGDYLVATQNLRPNIGFPTCSKAGAAAFDFSANQIWFDSVGVPRLCTAGNCVPETFQIVISSTELPSNNRAREVEAVSSGLISTVPRGEQGFSNTVFAQTTQMTGAGACE